MRAAILAIGDELTCGYRLDTNSQAIARRLVTVPIDVTLHMTVSDEAPAIRNGLRVTLENADIVVASGGLGPTEDDLTRRVVADFCELPLVEDAEALAMIEERFAQRGRTMPESNRIQASIPSGCEVIHNERGTAAGFYLNLEDKHLFVTPGVPFEMEGMLEGFIMPRLREVVDSEHYVARTMLKVYGLPESEINERVRPMLHRNRNPLLGLLPEQGTITVEIVAIGATASEAQALIDADTAALYAELGANVISEDDRAMPEVTGDLLSERGLTVATTEVGSAGLLAARLTEPRGSDRWFRSGLVLSPLAAARLLEGTPLDDEEAAKMLARQARERTLADIGVGVSALFEPSDQSTRLPYRTVCVALSTSQKEWSDTLRFRVGRARQWAAEAALASIRQHLLDYE